MSTNELTYATDLDGRDVVGVLLSNRPVAAWLYADDFARIRASYPNAAWSLTVIGPGRSYVRIRSTAENAPSIYVARLVSNDPPRTAIRFKDGDSLNLRRTNLYAVGGGGRCPKKRGRPSFRRDVHPAVRNPRLALTICSNRQPV